jgi:hypothetical protein
MSYVSFPCQVLYPVKIDRQEFAWSSAIFPGVRGPCSTQKFGVEARRCIRCSNWIYDGRSVIELCWPAEAPECFPEELQRLYGSRLARSVPHIYGT